MLQEVDEEPSGVLCGPDEDGDVSEIRVTRSLSSSVMQVGPPRKDSHYHLYLSPCPRSYPTGKVNFVDSTIETTGFTTTESEVSSFVVHFV